jgi:hypothetical protein
MSVSECPERLLGTLSPSGLSRCQLMGVSSMAANYQGASLAEGAMGAYNDKGASLVVGPVVAAKLRVQRAGD